MVKALRVLRTERIWQTTAERDGLISCVSFRLSSLVASLLRPLSAARRERLVLYSAEKTLTFSLPPLNSNCFLRPLSLLSESESYLKVAEIKAGIFRVLCLAAKGHGQMFSAFSPSFHSFPNEY
jgi:condensin complex subunit 1